MNILYTLREAVASDSEMLRSALIENGQKATICIDGHSLYLYASAGDHVVGLIGAELCNNNALIRSLAVLAAYRHGGVATELVHELIRRLRQRDVAHLYLFSKSTGGFWMKHGFEGCDVKRLVDALPAAPQVCGYVADGSVWRDVGWYRRLDKAASHYEFTDDEFERLFADCVFASDLFSHEAHLRLAFIHVKKYGEAGAIMHITGQIKRYVNKLGVTDKYNETVTVAAIKIVNRFYKEKEWSSFKVFIDGNERLINGFRSLLQSHYSKDIFGMEEARSTYLEPDLLAFDV